MKKQAYIIPEMNERHVALLSELLGLSAPGPGIHDGGEGDDDDDPTAKERGFDDWGSLW